MAPFEKLQRPAIILLFSALLLAVGLAPGAAEAQTPIGTFTIGASSTTVTEGTDVAITLTRVATDFDRRQVRIQTSGGADVGIADGTRTHDIIWSNGVTEVTLTFGTTDDTADETDATVTFTLLGAPSDDIPYNIGTPASVTVTVEDNDEPAPAPTVTGVSLQTAPASGDTFGVGETITVRVAYSAALTVTGAPRLPLAIGDATRYAAYDSATSRPSIGTSGYLEFNYTVQGGDNDADGISVPGPIDLNNGAIAGETGGTAANLALGTHAIANSANHKVSTTRPGLTISTTTTTLTEGEDVSITVTRDDTSGAASFNVNLAVTAAMGDSKFGLPDGASRLVAFADGVATATVVLATANDQDDNPGGAVTIALAAGSSYTMGSTGNSVAVTITDNDSVPAAPTINSLGTTGVHTFTDDTDPDNVVTTTTTSLIIDWSAPADLGEVDGAAADFDLHVIDVQVEYREYSNPEAPCNDMATAGCWTRVFSNISGASAIEIQPLAPDTEYEVRMRLETVVGDGLWGVARGRTFVPPNTETGETGTPTVTRVTISEPANGDTFLLGETITVQVLYGGVRLDVTGTPQVALRLGRTDVRYADFSSTRSHTGGLPIGAQLVFEYTVQRGDNDDDGLSIYDDPTDGPALRTNGGTIKVECGHEQIQENPNCVAEALPASLEVGNHEIRNSANHQVDGTDRTAPTLSEATVSGTTLALIYDEPLDTSSVPATGAFTVTVAGTARAVSNVAVAGNEVKLTLADPAVQEGEAVTVSYTVPDTNPIQDEAGNDAEAFSDHTVTLDTTAPVLSTAVVDGATLTLTYNEALDAGSAPAASAFAVTVAGAARTVSNVAVGGSAVTLTLASAVAHGETVTLDYTVPTGMDAKPIQDAAGNDAAALDDEAVTNSTDDTTAPTLSAAAVNGATLTLTYDEELDADSVPPASAFTVRVDGSPRALAENAVAISGRAATLMLISAVTAGQTVTVSYTPGTNPIQDAAGNDAAALVDQAVTNRTGDPTPAPDDTTPTPDGDTTAPALDSATISDASLVLTYDEALDESSAPAAGAFTVMTGGATVKIDSVAVAGRAVTLALRPASIIAGAVTVSYAMPSTNPIQDLAGNDAGRLHEQAVRDISPPPGITMTAASPSPLPEGGSATYTVRLNAMPKTTSPAAVVTIALSDDDPSVRVEPPLLTFAAVSGRGRWDRPQRVTIHAAQDDDVVDETVTITHRVEDGSSDGYAALGDVTFTVTVDDDDKSALSVADATGAEGPGAMLGFAVTLDRASPVPVAVDYATSDGTAVAGQDYAATSGTLTFAAGETAKTVQVPVLDDAHDEGEETFSLRLVNPRGAFLGDSEATGTIEDADQIPAALLARIGRATAAQVVEHVEERMAAPRQRGFRARLAGRELLPGSERDFALGFLSSFAQPMGRGPAGAAPMGGAARGGAAAMGMGPHVAGAGMPGMGGPGGGMSGSTGMSGSMGVGGLGAGGMTGAMSMAGPRPMGYGPVGAAHETGLFSSMLGQDPLANSELELNRESRGGILSVWGRVSLSDFRGVEDALSLDGDVRTTMVGADYSRGALTFGLSVGHTLGRGSYSGPSGGRMSTSMAGVYPWVGYQVNDRVSVWATGGYGAGSLSLTPDGQSALETDVSMMMSAVGTRGELVGSPSTGGFSLAFKADALWVGAASDLFDGAAGRLNAAEAEVTRVRTALEGSQSFSLGGRLSLKPSVEVGLRHDDGDAERGAGMDVGGGLAFTDTVTGLSLNVRVRTLVVHEAEGFRDRGLSVSLGWDPTPSSPLGLSAKVAPSWGNTATGGAEALWGGQMAYGMGSHQLYGSGGQLHAEVGYGLPVGARFVGTPRVGLRTSQYGRDYQAGYGVGVIDQGDVNFELGVEAQRRESPMAGTRNGFLGQATLGW